MKKQLMRSGSDQKIAGVCVGSQIILIWILLLFV